MKHEQAFKTLLILDTLRGIDSTGAVVVHRDGTFDTPKAVGNAYNLLESRVFSEGMKGLHSALIGHNRYATQGKVNVRSAHPFEFDEVVGCHNGTLRNKHVLENGHKFDVDSEALYGHINNNGVEDAIKGLDGAWALTWYNIKEGTLNFLRNKERPLWMTSLKEGQLAWASEKWMLEVALARHELTFTDPQELPVDQWHKISLFADGSLGKPHVVPLASRFQPYVSKDNGHRHGGTYTTGPSYVSTGTQTTGTSNASSVPSSSSGTVGVTSNFKNADDETFTYPKGQEVRLFVFGLGHDTQGGKYYMCRDDSSPSRNIRLFINQGDKSNLLNKHIHAEIHAFTIRNRYGLYYKVQHSTVRLAKEDVPDITKEVVEEIQNDSSSDRFFHDSQGRLISHTDWHKKHGTCGWCSGHVNPNLAFKFTTSGDAICHECAADQELSGYVNFQ